jgi:hypothetical protein
MNIWHQATTSSGEHHQATRLDVALTIGSLLLIHFQITCTAMEVEFAWPEFSLGLLRWLSGLVYFNMGSLVAAECQGDAFNVFGMFVGWSFEDGYQNTNCLESLSTGGGCDTYDLCFVMETYYGMDTSSEAWYKTWNFNATDGAGNCLIGCEQVPMYLGLMGGDTASGWQGGEGGDMWSAYCTESLSKFANDFATSAGQPFYSSMATDSGADEATVATMCPCQCGKQPDCRFPLNDEQKALITFVNKSLLLPQLCCLSLSSIFVVAFLVFRCLGTEKVQQYLHRRDTTELETDDTHSDNDLIIAAAAPNDAMIANLIRARLCVNCICVTFTLCYASLVSTICKFFDTSTDAQGNSYMFAFPELSPMTDYMLADTSTEVSSTMAGTATACVVVLTLMLLPVVVLPTLIANLLYRASQAKTLQTDAQRQTIGFFYDRYHTECYWFGFVMLAQRGLLICVSVFWKASPVTIGLLSIFILLIAIAVQVRFEPYRGFEETDDKKMTPVDMYQLLCYGTEILTFLVGLITLVMPDRYWIVDMLINVGVLGSVVGVGAFAVWLVMQHKKEERGRQGAREHRENEENSEGKSTTVNPMQDVEAETE